MVESQPTAIPSPVSSRREDHSRTAACALVFSLCTLIVCGGSVICLCLSIPALILSIKALTSMRRVTEEQHRGQHLHQHLCRCVHRGGPCCCGNSSCCARWHSLLFLLLLLLHLPHLLCTLQLLHTRQLQLLQQWLLPSNFKLSLSQL